MLLCYLYETQPNEVFFGNNVLRATQQLSRLMEEWGGNDSIMIDCEAALMSEHLGLTRTGVVDHAWSATDTNCRLDTYPGSGLFTVNNALSWASFAEEAGLKQVAEQCAYFLYFNGWDVMRHRMHHRAPSPVLGPLVSKALQSLCHGEEKLYYGRWVMYGKNRATKFSPSTAQHASGCACAAEAGED